MGQVQNELRGLRLSHRRILVVFVHQYMYVRGVLRVFCLGQVQNELRGLCLSHCRFLVHQLVYGCYCWYYCEHVIQELSRYMFQIVWVSIHVFVMVYIHGVVA